MNWIIILIVLVIGFFGAVTTPAPVDVREPECAVLINEGPRKDSTPEDGCSAPASSWQPVEVNGIEGVIVSEEDGWTLIAGESYWMPSQEDLEAAETAIATDQGVLEQHRQYVGFTEDGVAKVYINGFCDDFDMDWRSTPIVVEDGGDCYFTAVYNVDSGELEWFTFNGDA